MNAKSCLLVAAILPLVGCAPSWKAIPSDTTYASVPVKNVAILRERPQIHFIQLGVVRGSTIQELRREAARLGAQAIWLRPAELGSSKALQAVALQWLPPSIG